MMKSDCDRCIHADKILGYDDSEDMFVCDIEDELSDEDVECANEGKCPHYVCANEFEPCPMCGKRLTARDIIFVDDEGYPIGDLDSVMDFEDLCNPINIIYDGETDDEERKRTEDYHGDAVDAIDHVFIECSCGFMYVSNTAQDYRDEGWFEQFKKEANRRKGYAADLY